MIIIIIPTQINLLKKKKKLQQFLHVSNNKHNEVEYFHDHFQY